MNYTNCILHQRPDASRGRQPEHSLLSQLFAERQATWREPFACPVELDAGLNAAVVQLSSVDCDWTEGADGDWVHVGPSDAPVVVSVGTQRAVYQDWGRRNTKTAPRSARHVRFDRRRESATVKVDQQARAALSKWVFQASALPLYGSS